MGRKSRMLPAMNDPFASDLDPERPAEEGIDTAYPDADQQEGVHMLANQAKDELKGEGFSEEQIFEWATAYVEQVGAGTVVGLIDYIKTQESSG